MPSHCRGRKKKKSVVFFLLQWDGAAEECVIMNNTSGPHLRRPALSPDYVSSLYVHKTETLAPSKLTAELSWLVVGAGRRRSGCRHSFFF